jgi:hypothetical protein
MKSEEVAIRIQLEHGGEPSPAQRGSNSEAPANDRRFFQDKGEPRAFDDDEEYDGRFPVRGGVAGGMDLTCSLMIFVIFAIMDLVFFLSTANPFMALPLVVHGVFLPFLFYIAVKQKRGGFPPSTILTFIQLIIAYMVVYMGAEIVAAIFQGNIVMVGIYIFIGIFMVFIWSRVLRQLKYVFGRQ